MLLHKYLNTLFTSIQCSFPRFEIYMLKTPTALAISSLVQTIAYIKLPTTLEYGTHKIYSSSYHALGHDSTYNFTTTWIGTLTALLSCMLNLYSIVSTYFLWFKPIFLFAQSLLISIPRMKFTATRSFMSNSEDRWDFISFITCLFFTIINMSSTYSTMLMKWSPIC